MPLSSMGSVKAARGRVESLKMGTKGAGTEVPETLSLACFAQPPTTVICSSWRYLLPSFPVLSFP